MWGALTQREASKLSEESLTRLMTTDPESSLTAAFQLFAIKRPRIFKHLRAKFSGDESAADDVTSMVFDRFIEVVRSGGVLSSPDNWNTPKKLTAMLLNTANWATKNYYTRLRNRMSRTGDLESEIYATPGGRKTSAAVSDEPVLPEMPYRPASPEDKRARAEAMRLARKARAEEAKRIRETERVIRRWEEMVPLIPNPLYRTVLQADLISQPEKETAEITGLTVRQVREAKEEGKKYLVKRMMETGGEFTSAYEDEPLEGLGTVTTMSRTGMALLITGIAISAFALWKLRE